MHPGGENLSCITICRLVTFLQDLFFLQLLQLAKRYMTIHDTHCTGSRISNLDLMEAGRKALSFKLTKGQSASLKDIVNDLGKPTPMLRLLQGDVGSGKTIISFLAMLAAAGSGTFTLQLWWNNSFIFPNVCEVFCIARHELFANT